MPEVWVGETRVYYQEQGRGQPLLLLHCGLGTGGDFAAIRGPLAQRYTVLTPDRPGYGRSAGEVAFDDGYFAAQVAWMNGFLDALGVPAAHCWGWSDGGVIALRMAIRHPERVRALVIEAGHLRGRKPSSAFFEAHLRPEELPAAERGRLAQQHGAGYWPELARRWAGLWLDLHRRDADLYDGRLGEVRAPTLVLNADDDPHVPAEEARALQAQIPGAALHLFPGGGHALHAGPAREQVLEAARSFLQGLEARSERGERS